MPGRNPSRGANRMRNAALMKLAALTAGAALIAAQVLTSCVAGRIASAGPNREGLDGGGGRRPVAGHVKQIGHHATSGSSAQEGRAARPRHDRRAVPVPARAAAGVPCCDTDRRFARKLLLKRTPPHSLHTNTRMKMDARTAREIAQMDGVDRAWVLVTEKNAYVAVLLHRAEASRAEPALDERIRTRIANAVKARHPNICNVFASARPDFAGRLHGYARKIENGEPTRGLILEFNRAAKRLFPNRTGPEPCAARHGSR